MLLVRGISAQDIGYQKSEMKTVILDQPQVHLEDFVGEQSWLLFQLLAVNTDWMQTASIHWTQSDQYLRFVNIVKSLKLSMTVRRGLSKTSGSS